MKSVNIYGLKGESKDKVSLCLTKHHAMKTYWGMKVSSTHS